MIHSQYNVAYNTTAGTLTLATSGNITVHTIVSPIASVGTFKLKGSDFVTLTTFPIGTIGTMLLDASFANGLYLVSSTTDSVLITYQTP